MAYDGRSRGVGGRLRAAARFARPGADGAADPRGPTRMLRLTPPPSWMPPRANSRAPTRRGRRVRAARRPRIGPNSPPARSRLPGRPRNSARAKPKSPSWVGSATRSCGRRPRQQVDTLQQQLASMQAKQTERGIVLTVGDVLFDIGQATLKPGAVNEIVRLAQFLAGEPRAQGPHRGPHRQHRLDHDQPGPVAAARRSRWRTRWWRRAWPAIGSWRPGLGRTSRSPATRRAAGRQQNRRVEVVIENAPTVATSSVIIK